jgi:hypothetical protein
MAKEDRKFSLASVSSTCAGETSSESAHSSDDTMFSETKMKSTGKEFPELHFASTDGNCINTVGLQNFTLAGEDDLDSPFCVGRRDDMPSTREPSPEPLWHHTDYWNLTQEYFSEQIETYGRFSSMEASVEPPWKNVAHYEWKEEHIARQNQVHSRHLPRKSSREPPIQRGVEQPPAQLYQMMLVVPKPVLAPTHDANAIFLMNHFEGMPVPAAQMPSGKPAQGKGPAQNQANPTCSTHSTPVPEEKRTPAPEQKVETPVARSESKRSSKAKIPLTGSGPGPAPVPEPKEQAASAHAKQNSKANSRGDLKGDTVFDKLSDDQKKALCKYIYDFMLQKEFTSPEGYLIVDIFSEVWKGMSDSAQSWKVAQHRFNDLLRFAPQYFRLFRKSIRIANHCGWYARKGQQMVSIIRDGEN